MKRLIPALAILTVAVVWGTWLVAIPADVLKGAAEDAFTNAGLKADLAGFKKGPFYSVGIKELSISHPAAGRLFTARDLTGALSLGSLLMLKAEVPFRGTTAGGALEGKATVGWGGSREAEIRIRDARLGETGLLELAGIAGDGRLSADIHMAGRGGEAKVTVDDLSLEPVSLMGFRLPLEGFSTFRGMVFFKGEAVDLESLVLEGQGAYARMRGEIKGGRFDGTLELMPDRDMLNDQVLTSILRRYEVSKGHYEIPIRRKLSL